MTLYEQKVAENVCVYGPIGLSAYIDNIRFIFGSRILSYSVCDLFGNSQRLLGISSDKLMDTVLKHPDYNKIFLKMNDYLEPEL